jgi:hypothetical protein
MSRSPDKWIKGALGPESKGKLHKNLGIPAGEKISSKKLSKAAHSKNPTIKKEAVLAETLKGFRKK